MLKFNYGKQGTVLESVADPIEDVINRRVVLAMRSAQPIHMEPSFVSLIVPSEIPEVQALAFELTQGNCDAVSLSTQESLSDLSLESIAPSDFISHDIEVIMRGVWLTHHPDAEEGVFFTSLTTEIEEQIEELWTYQPVASS